MTRWVRFRVVKYEGGFMDLTEQQLGDWSLIVGTAAVAVG